MIKEREFTDKKRNHLKLIFKHPPRKDFKLLIIQYVFNCYILYSIFCVPVIASHALCPLH